MGYLEYLYQVENPIYMRGKDCWVLSSSLTATWASDQNHYFLLNRWPTELHGARVYWRQPRHGNWYTDSYYWQATENAKCVRPPRDIPSPFLFLFFKSHESKLYDIAGVLHAARAKSSVRALNRVPIANGDLQNANLWKLAKGSW